MTTAVSAAHRPALVERNQIRTREDVGSLGVSNQVIDRRDAPNSQLAGKLLLFERPVQVRQLDATVVYWPRNTEACDLHDMRSNRKKHDRTMSARPGLPAFFTSDRRRMTKTSAPVFEECKTRIGSTDVAREDHGSRILTPLDGFAKLTEQPGQFARLVMRIQPAGIWQDPHRLRRRLFGLPTNRGAQADRTRRMRDADDRDEIRFKSTDFRFKPLARAAARPARVHPQWPLRANDVGHADPRVKQLALIKWREYARRESGRTRRPEPISRTRKIMSRGGGVESRIDSDKQELQGVARLRRRPLAAGEQLVLRRLERTINNGSHCRARV